jgi:glycosyltransferase involved in cell wall biosynthesis
MMRLAWFTPLPPVRSGISRYSCELLPGLAASYSIDVFVDGPPERFEKPDGLIQLLDAYDFSWRHRHRPYDLIVYQLGNARCHDYMWAYLVRHPGLVVLHDGQLHHARARFLLQQKKHEDYRREFRFNHPDAHPDVAELAIPGLLGALTYFWPMRRTVMESARHVAVHSPWLGDELRRQFPGTPLSLIEMGVPPSRPRADARNATRARYSIPDTAVLFVAFGNVTPEKRIREVIRALAGIVSTGPDARLLLAGEVAEHYAPMADARTLGIEDRVSVAGFVPDDEIDDYLAAADVCLCLRWPTSRETSASWLRCLAAGKPTVTSDLAHLVDIPTVDARDGSPLGGGAPVGVGVDILDEKHALALALRRLSQDAGLRAELGRNGRDLWAKRFGLAQMVDRYQTVIAVAADTPTDRVRASLPEHLVGDGMEHAAHVLKEAGFPGTPTAGIWTRRSE